MSNFVLIKQRDSEVWRLLPSFEIIYFPARKWNLYKRGLTAKLAWLCFNININFIGNKK